MLLIRAPRAFLRVDRTLGQLTLWTRRRFTARFEHFKTYPVSVGIDGYLTPEGPYIINTKAKCPDWLVPDSAWAIELGLIPGTIIPGCDPTNPLKMRWLGVTDPVDGVGIHGTARTELLGQPASHGCIRMSVPDVMELFDLVPKGATIDIL
jgi:lipoprotein-anchoring transpeptidase ErfK/SrfK